MSDYYHPYNKALSTAQMQVNAVWIRNYLQAKGWSLNAIAACLGNWQSECTLNPNRCSNKSYPYSSGGGFGLPQWTPYNRKMSPWCKAQGVAEIARDDNPAGTIEVQIAFHDYDCRYGYNGKKTWYNNRGYHYTWDGFKVATDDVRTMAIAYYWQYERSGVRDPGSRPAQAAAWYSYLSGQPYSPILGPSFVQRPGILSLMGGNLSFLWVWYLILYLLKGAKK